MQPTLASTQQRDVRGPDAIRLVDLELPLHQVLGGRDVFALRGGPPKVGLCLRDDAFELHQPSDAVTTARHPYLPECSMNPRRAVRPSAAAERFADLDDECLVASFASRNRSPRPGVE